MPSVPRLEYLYTLTVELGPLVTVGDTPHGLRLIVPVLGGTFAGPTLQGRVLPGGGDWLLIRRDGVAELDVRGTLETADRALIYTHYRGYATNIPTLLPRWAAGETIPRDAYYFAATPIFETGAEQYAWLQRVVTVGIAELIPGGVRYEVFTVQ